MYSVHAMNADDDMEITLPILQTIEQHSNITQRGLSKRLGLALGLTNAYVKHCVNKGLVKIEQIPANRYLYYLTPQGLAEKGRLTAQYLSDSFKFYRKASDSCLQVFTNCHAQGWQDVVLCGVSDLAEIAVLQAARAGIHIIGVYDPRSQLKHFLQYVIWRDVTEIPPQAVCVITSLGAPYRTKQSLMLVMPNERILVPDILGL